MNLCPLFKRVTALVPLHNLTILRLTFQTAVKPGMNKVIYTNSELSQTNFLKISSPLQQIFSIHVASLVKLHTVTYLLFSIGHTSQIAKPKARQKLNIILYIELSH